MKEMLGNGDIPDGIDARLKSYLKELRKNNADLADEMEAGLEDLYERVNQGEIIKRAIYVEQ